ncbi:hypothetical protein IGI04_023478, partial [Brassica rapa subsp. trilocularis]
LKLSNSLSTFVCLDYLLSGSQISTINVDRYTDRFVDQCSFQQALAIGFEFCLLGFLDQISFVSSNPSTI